MSVTGRSPGPKRWRLAGSFLFALVVLLAACDTDSDGSQSSENEDGTARGATLRIAVSDLGEEVWDPHGTSNQEKIVYDLIYDYMFALDEAGEEVSSERSLIESTESKKKGQILVLHVRDGVTFHNGDPLTAEDVAYALERQLAEDSPSARASALRSQIKKVEVPDESTVELTLVAPSPILETLLSEYDTTAGMIIPKDYFESVGPDGFQSDPIGSGPYKMDVQAPGQRYELVANEDYWGEDLGLPKWDRIVVLITPDEATRANLLRAEEADVVATTRESARQLQDEGFPLVVKENAFQSALRLRGQSNPDSPLSNINVRKAMALAIDKEAIAETIYSGFARPAEVFPIGSYDEGLPEDAEPFPYDPEEARRLLSEAGYGDGLELHAVLYSFNVVPELETAAEAIFSMLGEVGIRVERENYADFAEFVSKFTTQSRLKEGIHYFAQFNRVYGGQVPFGTMHSTSGFSTISDPEIDSMVEGIIGAPDVETYRELMVPFLDKVKEEVLTIPVVEMDATTAYREGYVCPWSEGFAYQTPRVRYIEPCT